MQQINRIALAVTLALAGSHAVAGEHTAKVLAGLNAGRAHVADELIVQYKFGASSTVKGRALGRAGAGENEVLLRAHQRQDGRGDMELVSVPVGKSLAQAIKELESDPAVEFAEPNWVYQHAAVSNDPQYTSGALWGMYGNASTPANQWGSQAGEKWPSKTDCSDV